MNNIIHPNIGQATFDSRPHADNFNRVVKIAVDSGDVKSIDAAYDLFRTYRLGVRVGTEARDSAAHQAALLTIVNVARRALLGGVFIQGDLEVPLAVPMPGYETLADAVTGLGGSVVENFSASLPILILGTVPVDSTRHQISLRVVFNDWRGGVVPESDNFESNGLDAIAPAAILAGAFAVSEIFQHLRGNPMAGRRRVGLSLWSPENLDWEHAETGPNQVILPSKLWMIGLGHLGQAYLWVLGLLPYQNPKAVSLVLHDFDRLVPSNDSTSLLTNSTLVGQLKTRAMAIWAETRGFRTTIVERPFPGGITLTGDEPRLAIGGVDNPLARAAYEDAGFDWIVEAGLGSGPIEYLALRLHTFPASTTARTKWGGTETVSNQSLANSAAYQMLASEGMDECGLVRLATRSVGAPFVGTVAATLVISEILRFLNGGKMTEVIDLTLRDPNTRSLVFSPTKLSGFNPGYTL